LLAPTLPVVAQTETSAWTEHQPMLLPRSEASVAELNGKIYVMGGYPGARITSDSVQVYDVQTDSWELGPPLPRPLHHTMAAMEDGKLYVAGGRFGGGVGSEMTDVVEIYDPVANTWSAGARMLAPRAGVTAIAANGCLYLIGGEGNDASERGVFDLNERYDPISNAWHSHEPLPLAMHGITGAAFLDGWI
jgi:N-acetylneuraminic acid mutarotase